MKNRIHLRLVHSERSSTPSRTEKLACALRGDEINVWLADADAKITDLAQKVWQTLLEVSQHHANAERAAKTRQLEDVREWRGALLAEKARRNLVVLVPRDDND